jgi:transcriptional regulator with XRE-family HTH domain
MRSTGEAHRLDVAIGIDSRGGEWTVGGADRGSRPADHGAADHGADGEGAPDHGPADHRADNSADNAADNSVDNALARARERRTALHKIGRAVLRLRLYYGWSQRDLEHRSKVDQTTISRLERGVLGGLSIRRLGAILDALHVGEIVFGEPDLIVAPTDLEIMLFGDRWALARQEADRRLRWPSGRGD